jgi:hypothetical protein
VYKSQDPQIGASGVIVADDGQSFAYLRGARTTATVRATRLGDCLHVVIDDLRVGWKPLRVRVVGYDDARRATVETTRGRHDLELSPAPWRLVGAPLTAAISDAITLA